MRNYQTKVSKDDAIEVYQRVLRLVDGYLRKNLNQDELVTFDGGLMTWREIRSHIKASLKMRPR